MRFDSARADQITAIVLFALGLAMLIGGYTMDRLEIRQIHPASIPGLLPMILGATMMVCALALFASASGRAERAAGDDRQEGAEASSASWSNLAFAAGYSIVYALVLVGTLPFFAATAIYISVFVIHFTFDPRQSLRGRAVRVALAIGFAVVSAAAVSLLFQEAFLVRLP
ncbi:MULTISPECIES: tripartite tricarboxylate transporter TctB family protein [unclassified Roseitalea]|uniref:tripartite tricarboxylate transporter TctB family protein n=1 Tax=unclassified Roseitalea TaxID=2639107 RepID=UPI00273EF607|nr:MULTISPECIES: tripartite tricarboxylate transporter TctB family protein [unclassified Roseitalea]